MVGCERCGRMVERSAAVWTMALEPFCSEDCYRDAFGDDMVPRSVADAFGNGRA